jgi:glutaconyl-CoA/methylmalonyl-CoA decarboxylase subunit gamma
VKLRISVEGKSYEVDVEVVEEHTAGPVLAVPARPLPAPAPPAQSAPPQQPASAPGSDRVCRSPIAGVITSILAAPGQSVSENDALMIVEAMKMETKIASPMAGVVKSVPVSNGDGVKVGQVLVEFE